MLETTDNFPERTTFHGVRNIFDKQRSSTRRFVWFIIVLASAFGYGYLTYISLKTFLKYESTSKITVREELVKSFPAVSVCAQTVMKKSVLSQYDGLTEVLKTARTQHDPEYLRRHRDILNNASLYDVILKSLGKKEDMFTSCEINNLTYDACLARFHTTMTEKNVCFTFQGYQYLSQQNGSHPIPKMEKVYLPGYTNGLRKFFCFHKKLKSGVCNGRKYLNKSQRQFIKTGSLFS